MGKGKGRSTDWRVWLGYRRSRCDHQAPRQQSPFGRVSRVGRVQQRFPVADTDHLGPSFQYRVSIASPSVSLCR